MIGPYTSGSNLGMRVSSFAQRPELITERWEAGTGEGSWTPVKRFKVVCVKHTFITCNSGSIVIGGLNRMASRFRSLMGSYELMDVTYQLRPVYRHTMRDSTFLYFLNGMWLIGFEVGVISSYMFVVDNAFRPEYIVHSWIGPFQFQFTEFPGVRVVCEGRHAVSDCDYTNSSINARACIHTRIHVRPPARTRGHRHARAREHIRNSHHARKVFV